MSPFVATAVSTDPDAVSAMRTACEEIRAVMGDRPITLAVLFMTDDLSGDPWTLHEELRRHLTPEHLIGTVTDAVVADARELENTPGLVLWAASLPGATVEGVRFVSDPDAAPTFVGSWPEWVSTEPNPTLIVLSDPASFPLEVLLAEHRHVGLPPIVGGQASGAGMGNHVMFLDDEVFFDGAVGIALSGVSTVAFVAQGAIPVGPEMVITAGGGTVIEELAGVRAYDRIMGILRELDEEGHPFTGAPMLGIVINENVPEYTRDDFLIRALQGHDPTTGAIHVSEHVRVGQTVRLHSLSGEAADDDLSAALDSLLTRITPDDVIGTLLFTCNGRGSRLFGGPHHDAETVTGLFPAPLAGMFANGEIGSVAGETFLHGFTASVLMLTTLTEIRHT